MEVASHLLSPKTRLQDVLLRFLLHPLQLFAGQLPQVAGAVVQDLATGGQHRARLPWHWTSSKGERLSGMDLWPGVGGWLWQLSVAAVEPVGRPLKPHKPGVTPSSAPSSSAVPGSRGGVQIPFWHCLGSSEVTYVECLAHSKAVSPRGPELSPDPGPCLFF